MARFHKINGERVQFTPEEETARDAEELAWEEIKPFRKWQESMQETDFGMPRYAEDILDGMADKSGVPIITLYRLQAKKDLRKAKPHTQA